MSIGVIILLIILLIVAIAAGLIAGNVAGSADKINEWLGGAKKEPFTTSKRRVVEARDGAKNLAAILEHAGGLPLSEADFLKLGNMKPEQLGFEYYEDKMGQYLNPAGYARHVADWHKVSLRSLYALLNEKRDHPLSTEMVMDQILMVQQRVDHHIADILYRLRH